jgi:citrate lyase subunit beta / citryl-CoA lyase
VIDWREQTLRSLLFAPGNHPRRLERVGQFGSDAIVLDLEDAVADSEKTAARSMTFDAVPTYDDRTVVMVRVNAVETGRTRDDIDAVVRPELDCLLLPKVEDPAILAEVDEMIAAAESAAGIDEDAIKLIVLVETAKGLVRVEEICAAAPARVLTIGFGAGDFTTDLGIDMTRDARELLYARSRIVVAARAAGLRAPIDGPYLDLKDAEGLHADTLLSRQLGFEGRVVVYPPQLEQVLPAYSDLTDDEVMLARNVVASFEEAEAQGLASIQVDGRFVDYPIYHRAKKKLRLYHALRERS